MPLLRKEGASSGAWPGFWIDATDRFLRHLGDEVEKYLKRGYGSVKLRQVSGGSGLSISFDRIKNMPPNFFYDPTDPDSPPQKGSISLQMNHFDGLLIYPNPGNTAPKVSIRELLKAGTISLVGKILDSVDLGRLM